VADHERNLNAEGAAQLKGAAAVQPCGSFEQHQSSLADDQSSVCAPGPKVQMKGSGGAGGCRSGGSVVGQPRPSLPQQYSCFSADHFRRHSERLASQSKEAAGRGGLAGDGRESATAAPHATPRTSQHQAFSKLERDAFPWQSEALGIAQINSTPSVCFCRRGVSSPINFRWRPVSRTRKLNRSPPF